MSKKSTVKQKPRKSSTVKISRQTKPTKKPKQTKPQVSKPKLGITITRRWTRDIAETLSFTRQVVVQLVRDWQLFGLLLVLLLVVVSLTAGVMSQADYRNLTSSLTGTDGLTGSLVLFANSLATGLGVSLSDNQGIVLLAVNSLAWLVIIWLLRQRLADIDVRLRDGLYNGPASLISSIIVWFFISLELIPVAIGSLIFALAVSTGITSNIAVAIVFGLVALALLLGSLYLVVAGIMAAITVTLPGVYPWAALKSAHKMVKARRLGIIGRFVWLGLVLLVVWAVILIPVIVLDGWLKIDWLPLVPVVAQVLGSASLIFATTYVYLLYRSLIDESAA